MLDQFFNRQLFFRTSPPRNVPEDSTFQTSPSEERQSRGADLHWTTATPIAPRPEAPAAALAPAELEVPAKIDQEQTVSVSGTEEPQDEGFGSQHCAMNAI